MQKAIFFLTIISLTLLFSFGCNKKGTGPEEKLAAPTLVRPTNDTTLTIVAPILQWLAVDNAVSYEVVVDNSSNFASPEFDTSNVETTQCTVDRLPSGMNYWRVRAKNGEWSDVWHFTIDTTGPEAPTLLLPSNDEIIVYNNTPNFYWSDGSDAVTYELIVDNSSSFSSPEFDNNNLSVSRYTITTPLLDGTYYWRVRAMDNAGNWGQWSSVRSFKIYFHETGTMIDIDGNVYLTVKIGDQWWMAENLKVTHYRNGESISYITDNYDWAHPSNGAYCNYDHDEANADIYGRLYNSQAVRDDRKIAPEGWHTPTDQDWKDLEAYLGMSPSEQDDDGWRGTDEGDKLKNPDRFYGFGEFYANNKSGFSALTGGRREDGGTSYYNNWFQSKGVSAYFWSYDRYIRHLSTESGVRRFRNDSAGGFSVRLIKD